MTKSNQAISPTAPAVPAKVRRPLLAKPKGETLDVQAMHDEIQRRHPNTIKLLAE